jgi:hypothetical protein
MHALRAALLAPMLATALLLTPAAPALADEPSRPQDELERFARETAQKLMLGLSVMLQSIPQYEMPEVLPNGDIIIRRKLPPAPEIKPDRPERRPWPPEKPRGRPDQTET